MAEHSVCKQGKCFPCLRSHCWSAPKADTHSCKGYSGTDTQSCHCEAVVRLQTSSGQPKRGSQACCILCLSAEPQLGWLPLGGTPHCGPGPLELPIFLKGPTCPSPRVRKGAFFVPLQWHLSGASLPSQAGTYLCHRQARQAGLGPSTFQVLRRGSSSHSFFRLRTVLQSRAGVAPCGPAARFLIASVSGETCWQPPHFWCCCSGLGVLCCLTHE